MVLGLHRITGVATFFFLFVHVLDTALVRVNPDTYDRVIETYKKPLVGLMELALVAMVLYHALNGLRVMLVDFWSKGPQYQRVMLWVIIAIWFVVMIRVPDASSTTCLRGTDMTTEAKSLGKAYDRPASLDNPRSPRKPAKNNFELYAWLFMRFSGLALIILVLGHLFIMLMLDDGVHRINFAFVAGRWSSPFWQFWTSPCSGSPSCTAVTACARSSRTTRVRTPPGSGSTRSWSCR